MRVAARLALLPSQDRATKCGAASLPPTPRRRLQVICCSGARSTITADLARVDDVGVANLAKAFMDELVGCGRCRKNKTFGCREIPICVQADHTGCDL